MNILVVEDHDILRESMLDMLEQEGHQAVGVSCAEEVDDTVGLVAPDVYMIDLGLPGEDGMSLVQRVRQAQPQTDIIIVTARNATEDRVRAYRSGATLYLPKPIEPAELLAALKSIQLRREAVVEASQETLLLDLQALTLSCAEAQATLSIDEARVLAALARARDQTLEYWQVAEQFGYGDSINKAALEVRTARLRKKIRPLCGEQPVLRAVRHWGYRLCLPVRITGTL